ncbi:MAG: hypothetical protein ABI949_04455 [Ilumatobacteraceae bacterium]
MLEYEACGIAVLLNDVGVGKELGVLRLEEPDLGECEIQFSVNPESVLGWGWDRRGKTSGI